MRCRRRPLVREVRGDAPSARRRRALGLNTLTKPLLGLFDKPLDRFFGDWNAFTTGEGGVRLVQHRDEFEAPAHLREQGLIQTVRIHGQRSVAVILTDRGRDLLESRRNDRPARPQTFYAGVVDTP
jgi:hypothetical protein